MWCKNTFVQIFLIIITFIGAECEPGYTELYLKLLKGHNYLVPPSGGNISVLVNLELINLHQIDMRNQEMAFTAILNLQWKDSTLSWNPKEFSLMNRVTLPSDKIWTPNILIYNSASDSSNIQRADGVVFISPDGQIHWPIFGYFKTSCTMDVTYYPFDQQTCVIKVGTIDQTIQVNNSKDRIDLNQFYSSVFWNVIEAPAYRNVYETFNDDFLVETDVTYYLIIRRRTHWLTQVCPLLAFAFVTIIPAAITRSLEKLILQLFCIAGLFAVHKDVTNKLPPTSLTIPLVSKYAVALISYNLIHLILSTIIIYCRRECFGWIGKMIQIRKLTKKISRVTETNTDSEENQGKQDIEREDHEKNNLNRPERQNDTGGDNIVAMCNRIILLLLILAVVISTLAFLVGNP